MCLPCIALKSTEDLYVAGKQLLESVTFPKHLEKSGLDVRIKHPESNTRTYVKALKILKKAADKDRFNHHRQASYLFASTIWCNPDMTHAHTKAFPLKEEELYCSTRSGARIKLDRTTRHIFKYSSYAADGIRNAEDPGIKLYRIFDQFSTQQGENSEASNQAAREAQDRQDEAFHSLVQSHFSV